MSCESIIGEEDYTNRDYCMEQLLKVRAVFGNKNTTKHEWDIEVIRKLAYILVNGPEDLQDIVRATLYEAGIRETHFAIYIWPNQTSTKVAYSKWPKGTHWYAKVGNDDVVDEQGNQKWYTKKDAQKAVKFFKANNYS